MASSVALIFQNKTVDFRKSASLLALRARAGMAAAMQDEIDALATNGDQQTIGDFEVIDFASKAAGIDQELDRLRARPAIAMATHVFHIDNDPAQFVPIGHLHLVFDSAVGGSQQQAILHRYRLQAIETRGRGEFLVTVTTGSTNPVATAASLQKEPGIVLAEPEFTTARPGKSSPTGS